MRIRIGLLAVAALALSCASTSSMRTDSGERSSSAPAFAIRAARMDADQIESGRLAYARANDGSVRDFAKTMVVDHTRADGDLRVLARERGWTLPEGADADHRVLFDELEHVASANFDGVYMRAMVSDHVDAVSQLQRYLRTGADADLLAWARRTLVMEQKHQDLAQGASEMARPASSGWQ